MAIHILHILSVAAVMANKDIYIFKVIQGHVFWNQWKGDKGQSNTIYNVGLIC